ncbi:ShlB/FhaC/HecB family hemolysin secretion/activation protein [Paralcaligenes ureilyticus]|uniref:Hemolysin activation/secretion protein n=1 Tax=Paralcaligenes ureilyticus TaxID=627131 RepID=A0A4R3M9D3_9BURK|nr:ShlB/FhaC/HecB family hemolysin secretion/activation protein [Paralcaligenes ureilyticus]TCT10164.1 hemolysin activation/secretion protein [Paralcaligenes ureilyticus]
MLRNKLLPLAILGLAILVSGQSAFAVDLPTAGSQIQQIPPPPTPEKAAPEVQVKQKSAPTVVMPDTVKILVNRLRVTGAIVYTEANLVALTGFKPASQLTLTELRAMAAKITDWYHKNGYFVARAYLPAQDIKGGVVTIAIAEGRYGKVILRNHTNLSDSLALSQLSGINTGDTIAIDPLDSRLLLLSDIPGVITTSTLTPSASPGASDLIVDVAPGRRITGSIDADNAGNRYTGEYRLGATVNFNDLLGRGDVASVRAMTSGRGMNYGRASYQMQFGKATVGVAYSRLGYRLGKEFEDLDANGTAEVASVYGSYPLIRSRNNNLYAQLAYEDRTFKDRQDATGFATDKKAHVLMASLYGDRRDNLGGGGLNRYSLTWSFGNLNIQTPEARAYDNQYAHSNGAYNKIGFSASRLQHITDSVSFYAGIRGQWASKNLDISEKMELGGMYGVRAYPEGEAFGDQGYILNLEARWQLPKFAPRMPGQVQLIGFVDTGTVITNKSNWTSGPNRRTLSAAGVGINWAEANNFSVTAYYAHKLGNAQAQSGPNKSGLFWIQMVKYF